MSAFVERYLPYVRAAVRRRLPAGLRRRFDSTDLAQDVWVSFFRTAVERAEFPTEAAVIGYLMGMARRKVAEEERHQETLKVGLAREEPLAQTAQPAGRDPTASAVVIAAERWEAIVAGLPERDREILRMIRDGHTHAEVAAALGFTTKTVQRLVRRVSQRVVPACPEG